MTTVYELMARLRATNEISPELGRIAQSMTGILGLINQGHTGFQSWGLALKSIGGILAGAEILGGLFKIIEKTKELQTITVNIKRMGGPMADYAASGAAYKDAGLIARQIGGGLSTTDIMKILPQIHSIVDTPISNEMSRKLWPSIAAYAALQYSDENFRGNPTVKLRALMRAGMASGRITDEHGAIDEKKLERYLDVMARLKSLTHGQINEDTAFNLGKQGGPMLRSLSDEGYIAQMLIAQEVGGHRAGTAYISMWQQLGAGVMTKNKAEMLEKIGILPAGMWHATKGGGVKVDPEAEQQMVSLIAKDPMALANKLMTYFKSQGITDPEEQLRIIAGAFSRQTTQRYAAQLLMDFQQLQNERGMAKQGLGSQSSLAMKMDEDIEFNLLAVQHAWLDLITAFADPSSKNVVLYLHKIRDTLWGWTDTIKATDPEKLKKIGEGLAALGLGLTGAGVTGLLLAIGPAGWLVGLITALVYLNYDKARGLKGLVDDLEYYLDKLHSLGIKYLTARGAKEGALDLWNWWDKDVAPGVLNWLRGNSPKAFVTPAPSLPSAPSSPGFSLSSPGLKSWLEEHGMRPEPLEHNMSFNPGIDNKQILQPVMIKLDLDGRLLGQAVADILEDLFTHDMQAPFANRRASYSGPGQVQTG